MSGIFDQIINYSPPLIVSGTVNYKGTWNASTNNPTLNSSPAASTKGDYYVVSTAGTQFGITFAIGDWIISNGTAWEKVDLTDAVSSVFGRTGAVVGVSTDYSAVGLTNTAIGASNPSTGAFTTVTASSTIAATGAVTGSNLSGTNTGDQTTITGNAGSATVLQTPRAIYGNNFDGSAALTQAIAGTYGGTGVNNGANTITIAGNVTHAGAFTQSFTATANTALTLPVTGTLSTLAGSEALSNKTITASAFNGTVGATTPSTGAFTSVDSTGTITSTGTSTQFRAKRTGQNADFRILQGVNNTVLDNNNGDELNLAIAGTYRATLSSTGLAVTGALSATGAVTFDGVSFADGTAANTLVTTSGGNVGIGVTAPQQQLAIGGTNDQVGAGVSGTVSTLYFGVPSNQAGGIARLSYDRSTGSLSFIGNTVASPLVTMSINAGFGLAVTSAISAGGNISSTASTPFIVGTSATTGIIYYGSTGAASPVKTLVNNTVVTDVSSTGLAVTGTSTSSGSMRITTNNVYYRGTTSGNAEQILIGIGSDDNTAIVSKSGNTIKMDAGGTTRGTFSSTGLTLPSLGTGLVYSNAGLLTSTNPSDARLKTNITNLSYGLSSILALRPVSYKWLSDTVNQGTQYGFIAQEVQTVMPELVKEFETTEDGETVTRLGLEKEGIYAALVKAVQELNGLNTNLVAQVEILSQRLAALETK